MERRIGGLPKEPPKPVREDLSWKELEVGCILTTPGNTIAYLTGTWRTFRPEVDKTKCIKCGICYLFCPEGCIEEDEEGYFEANLLYCKGCGICARECWTGAIKMVEEA